jgi:hypothetical protein
VVDASDAMLGLARDRGRIKDLVPHLLEGGLTHLLYADDTILMIQKDVESIMNLKFLLYSFESMRGMKINYHKSEIYALEGDNESRE